MTVRGALNGGTLKDIARLGDRENLVSIATAAVFLAKDKFKESSPYSKGYDANDNLVVTPNLHFLTELRRQLSGDGAVGTSTFGPVEQAFYEEFQDYQLGVPKFGDLAIALEALDDWLVNAVTNTPQVKVERDYDADHQWNKTEDYIHDKGILWI